MKETHYVFAFGLFMGSFDDNRNMEKTDTVIEYHQLFPFNIVCFAFLVCLLVLRSL